MGAWLSKAWSGWLGWALIAVLGVGYFLLHMMAEDEDRADARAAQIADDVGAKVGADLRARSAARHKALMEKIKSGALMKAPASAAPATHAPLTD